MVIKVSQLCFLDTGIFGYCFEIKVHIFSYNNKEETYVAGGGGVQRNRVFSRFSQISPRPINALEIFPVFYKKRCKELKHYLKENLYQYLQN